ncbi:MAG TPA: histidine kinase dimerization/phospho-acceptor domain-containing protein [Candidatus Bathyarchaeia archaeon]|nr:histidine kinase dimerization/phospho-acceptor domain-containing protein [Candidatus Bathyarchaeia archaeon]
MYSLSDAELGLEMRNSEMERFVYTISHELRTPLVTVQGFVGMLRKDLEQNAREQMETDLKYRKQCYNDGAPFARDTGTLSHRACGESAI